MKPALAYNGANPGPALAVPLGRLQAGDFRTTGSLLFDPYRLNLTTEAGLAWLDSRRLPQSATPRGVAGEEERSGGGYRKCPFTAKQAGSYGALPCCHPKRQGLRLTLKPLLQPAGLACWKQPCWGYSLTAGFGEPQGHHTQAGG